MRKKIVLFLLLNFTFLWQVLGCLSASQERIFPLGTDNKGIVAIEAKCERYGMGDFGENLFWSYKLSLKHYDTAYVATTISVLDSNFRLQKDEIETFLKRQIKTALKSCESLKGFEKFEVETISFCDFQSSCSSLEIVGNGKSIGIKLLEEDKIHPVVFLDSNYTGESAVRYREYWLNYNWLGEDIFGNDLLISSVRKYKNSKYELVIFHLGAGHEFTSVTNDFPLKKEYPYEEEISSIEKAVFLEPVLHHGKGFDYFVWKKTPY